MAANAAMACAQPLSSSHGLSAFGDLKYPKEFTHFDYVNPSAPRGGALRLTGTVNTQTFDSFNPFILKGIKPEGLGPETSETSPSLVFDSLMTRAADEPDALYGLLAESVEMAPDRSRAIFHLRKSARFHDGSPVTAADVIFTIRTIKQKGHPQYRLALRDVTVEESKDPYSVEFRFTGTSRRDPPLIAAEMPIASAAYYKSHDFEKTSLDRPLGSGPYTIGAFKQGTYIEYDRVKDYWARDLAVNRGRWNFDRLRYEVYADRSVGFEAFKANAYDLREEFTAKTWALEYDFPAAKAGRVKRLVLPYDAPASRQGLFLNTRRAQLKDPRVREALDLAFDFEWMNRTLMYNAYTRTVSFFPNSGMAAEGPPSTDELKLLEPFRKTLPASVFGAPYVPEKSNGTGDNRANLRKALALLQAAGYRLVNGALQDGAGKRLTLELLDDDDIMGQRMQPYINALRQLGIDASVRLVDATQMELRRKSFDYDATIANYAATATPGLELLNYFTSSAAATNGTYNLAGVSNPAVDALVEAAIAAKSRAELTTAIRALDRVLRAGHYWVSQWHRAAYRIAYWDKFARPPIAPRYQRGIIDTWWSAPGPQR